ncbi:MAG: class I SAM-dependent methyltransferase [Thermoplasmata archaeon]
MSRRSTRTQERTAIRSAQRSWDSAIDSWEDFVEAGKDYSRYYIHGRDLLRKVGPVRGLQILDLGCGQGFFSRQLARRGGVVTGIDWSTRMLESARRHERERPLSIVYRRLDARRLSSLWNRPRFDLVAGSMSLMDMPEVSKVMRGVFRVLRPGGRFAFSISHPVNTAAVGWERPRQRPRGALLINNYFDEGPAPLRWNMKRLKRPFTSTFWHRSMESWFTLLRQNGFEVLALKEPRATPEIVRKVPLLDSNLRIPFFLIFECRKPSIARARES